LKKQYRGLCQEATNKSKQDHLGMECVLPMAELIGGMQSEIESFSAQLGLQIMRTLMEQEIQSRLGRHGSQSHYRHGQQPGYVVYGGRKASLERPRMRAVEEKKRC
jgi:hypothetical protein